MFTASHIVTFGLWGLSSGDMIRSVAARSRFFFTIIYHSHPYSVRRRVSEGGGGNEPTRYAAIGYPVPVFEKRAELERPWPPQSGHLHEQAVSRSVQHRGTFVCRRISAMSRDKLWVLLLIENMVFNDRFWIWGPASAEFCGTLLDIYAGLILPCEKPLR